LAGVSRGKKTAGREKVQAGGRKKKKRPGCPISTALFLATRNKRALEIADLRKKKKRYRSKKVERDGGEGTRNLHRR